MGCHGCCTTMHRVSLGKAGQPVPWEVRKGLIPQLTRHTCFGKAKIHTPHVHAITLASPQQRMSPVGLVQDVVHHELLGHRVRIDGGHDARPSRHPLCGAIDGGAVAVQVVVDQHVPTWQAEVKSSLVLCRCCTAALQQLLIPHTTWYADQDVCRPQCRRALGVHTPLRARKLTNHRKRLNVESFGMAELQKPGVMPGSNPCFTGIAAGGDSKVCEQGPLRQNCGAQNRSIAGAQHLANSA